MKRLIQNNFLYYFKNKTKLFISIGFILSFITMLFVYDNLELNTIAQDANKYRAEAYQYRSLSYMYPEINSDYLEEIDFWNSINTGIEVDTLFGTESVFIENYTGDDERISEQIAIMNRLDSLSTEMYELVSGYASLYSGGRMNVELTPYRHEINTLRLEIYDLVGEELALKLLDFENPQSYEYVVKEQERLDKLILSETPDDFNEYTVSIANYPSKALEGVMLFIIFVFTLMLFYDLFSKDFDFQTYRTIFTEPYTRKTIIKSKVYFALLYTAILIGIGMLSVIIYLLFSRRVGYNVLSTRFGYMFHPVMMNVGILSIFNVEPTYIVIPMILKNVISIITSSLLITVWLMFILTLSFKLKSSPSTLTIGVFALLGVFFINLTPLRDVFTYICPLFGFSYQRIFDGTSSIHIFYLVILAGIYRDLITRVLYKSLDDGDLLGGDNHD